MGTNFQGQSTRSEEEINGKGIIRYDSYGQPRGVHQLNTNQSALYWPFVSLQISNLDPVVGLLMLNTL